MLVHVDFAVALQLFCIVQGLTTGVYLLVGRPRRAEHVWLGLLLLGLTLQVADYFLSRSGIYYRHRWLYFTPLFFSWSFGPLLWAYVRARCGRGRLAWWHFGPVAVQVLFYVVLALQSFDTKTWFWLTVHKPLTRYIEYYGAIGLLLGYLGACLRLVRAPRLAGLRRLLLGLGLFYLAAALDPLLNRYYLPPGAPKFYLTSLVLPGLAYALAVAGWLRNRPVPPEPAPLPPPVALAPLPPIGPAPAKDKPSPEPLVDPGQLARLVQALEQDQLYHDPDLTLDSLARHLGLTPNAVSLLINAGLGQSFSDLVNGYRLAEVKQRLLTPDVQRLTVLALALEAGFNSKTTFNRVFKEKTGLTPKAYQKRYHPTHRDDSVAAPG